jgi:hypothetical protein
MANWLGAKRISAGFVDPAFQQGVETVVSRASPNLDDFFWEVFLANWPLETSLAPLTDGTLALFALCSCPANFVAHKALAVLLKFWLGWRRRDPNHVVAHAPAPRSLESLRDCAQSSLECVKRCKIIKLWFQQFEALDCFLSIVDNFDGHAIGFVFVAQFGGLQTEFRDSQAQSVIIQPFSTTRSVFEAIRWKPGVKERVHRPQKLILDTDLSRCHQNGNLSE